MLFPLSLRSFLKIKKSSLSKNLGVLGGGQLARMLALKANDMGVPVFILSKSKQDPAAQLSFVNWIKGDPYKISSLSRFLKQVDVLTFESEFISASQIQKALPNTCIHVAPSLKCLKLLQDRWSQKQILQKHQLQTADFLKVDLPKPYSSLKNQEKLLKVWKKLGPFVLKTRMGGYDGYGTFIVKRRADIARLRLNSNSFIAEKFINFKRELALLAARNEKGQVVFTPLVESLQKDSRCLWVQGPTTHKKLNPLKKKIKRFMKSLNYQGLLAFELFDFDSKLLVNELAPRTHNSGHYSLDCLTEDQFRLHLKGILNLPLSTPRPIKPGFAMLNLLGKGLKTPAHFVISRKKIKLSQGIEIKKSGLFIWWYGKTKNTKGRKMGHINTLESSPTRALNRLLKLRKNFKV